MDSHDPTANPGRKLLMHTVLSGLVVGVGVVLLIYMITVESEPGALPLGLIVLGIAWLVTARVRLRRA